MIHTSGIPSPTGSGRSNITYQLRLHESTINSGGINGIIETVYDEGSMRDDLVISGSELVLV